MVLHGHGREDHGRLDEVGQDEPPAAARAEEVAGLPEDEAAEDEGGQRRADVGDAEDGRREDPGDADGEEDRVSRLCGIKGGCAGQLARLGLGGRLVYFRAMRLKIGDGRWEIGALTTNNIMR